MLNDLSERMQKTILFWNSPDCALMPRDIVAAGISCSVSQLELLAVKGGGPSFHKFKRRCLYRKSDVIEWLERSSVVVASTSDM